MRIIRFLIVTLVAFNGVASQAARSVEVEPVDYIVSSQVVSDEVISGDEGVVGGTTGGCPNGACSAGLAGSNGYAGDLASGGLDGSCVPRTYGYPDLFYNYYTQGNCNATNAQMYLSPGPVPPNVGHTYYTYQPFMPQEMLYWHKDRFHNYYDGGRGMNHTKVHYYAPPVKQAASNLYWNFLRIPR